jgi:acyl-CoA dehydrogenase
VRSLLPQFAECAPRHDADESFVQKNYAALKEKRLMGLAIPVELGGDGLALRDLADIIRLLATACPSTALTFSMHTQAVASLAWHLRHHNAPVTSILRLIARDQLAVATTNGSDWLNGSGTAVRTRHGFRIDALKRTVSGAGAADLLATNAIYDDPMAGPSVLHFIVPVSKRHLKIEDTWHAMGMRGTASHNVRIKGLAVSDRSVIARRPSGKWHPLYFVAVMLAMPLIYSVYSGIAETASAIAIKAARKRKADDALVSEVGAMETHVNTVRIAVDDMLAGYTQTPDLNSTNRIMAARTLAGEAAISAVTAALTVAGSSAFMRSHPLERLFRDVQAARFHPMSAVAQQALAGRLALGLEAPAG